MHRLKLRTALAFLLLAPWCAPLSARYVGVQIEEVPVERLLKNLGAAVEKDPKNPQALLNLARVHAMAYSLKKDELQVRKDSPDRLWWGHEPPHVPFRNVTPTEDPDKQKVAKAHLDAAVALYEQALALAPDDLVVGLGEGWLLAEAGKKAQAAALLRKVGDKAWETEKDLKSLGLGGHAIAQEAATYLLPLLDPEKDKDELATLKDRIARLQRLPRPVTPIVIPLSGGLHAADLEDPSARVAFDLDGSGLPQEWTWTTRAAAWLVWDPARRGEIRSGLELFGNVTFWLFWETGYDALAALDDNGDGHLTGPELDGLALWHDANGNGIADPGEVRPLSDYGIIALSTKRERLAGHPDPIAFSPRGVTFRDGTTRPTFDLVLHSRP
jgi:hypothetical protein